MELLDRFYIIINYNINMLATYIKIEKKKEEKKKREHEVTVALAVDSSK